jgi:hypothetical protein
MTSRDSMARTEIVCPNCRQVNLRGMDSVGRLLDPRQPQLCTVCGTTLDTGKRSAGGFVLGLLGWSASYILNALVGAGGFVLLLVGIELAWPEFFESHSGLSRVMGTVCVLAGVLLGLGLAERARRRGQLHTQRKATKEDKS